MKDMYWITIFCKDDPEEEVCLADPAKSLRGARIRAKSEAARGDVIAYSIYKQDRETSKIVLLEGAVI